MVEEQHIVQQEQERALELEDELDYHPCPCPYPYHAVAEEAKQLIDASNDHEDDCIEEQVDHHLLVGR